MNPILKNILAIIAGIIIGIIVNIGIIMISEIIIPIPEGVDNTTTEGLKAGMHLFEAKHFIMPFLAHTLGAFIGAFVAAKLAASHKMKFAIAIGAFFLLGGIASVFMLPSPTWFTVLDLSLAYMPMGLLAGNLTNK